MSLRRPGIALAALSMLLLSACQSGYQTLQDKQRERAAKPVRSGERIAAAGTHTVQAGDTLFGIAFRAGLNYRDLAAWNGIDEPYTIRIGQKLRLTPPTRYADNSSLARNPAPLPNTRPRTRPAPVAQPIPNAADAAPVLSNIAWRWPAKGELVGRFVAGDKTRQGIDIAGKPGQRIDAAADGTVVYSGAGLIGYGELLIVKHDNEWISAYAHNARRLVAEGDKVKAGQHIADMGATGSVRTMLHFEVRRHGKPVDPLLYLPKP